MEKRTIATELADQFDRAWRMIRETITGFSETDWTGGGVDYLVPARIAYHIVETVEYYIGDKPSGKFAWGQRFGGDWKTIEKDQLPKQEDMLSYLKEIERRLVEWISHCDFQASNKLFEWTGNTQLGHVLYVLRHTLHHHGEMNYILFQSGYKKVNWH